MTAGGGPSGDRPAAHGCSSSGAAPRTPLSGIYASGFKAAR